MFIESASVHRNKDTADPVSSMISTATPLTIPLITVALFLTVATMTSCGFTDGDNHCPRQSPPIHFPVDRFSSHGLADHKRNKILGLDVLDSCIVGGQLYYKESNT